MFPTLLVSIPGFSPFEVSRELSIRLQTTYYLSGSLLCISVYELLACLPREVRSIWQGKWVAINFMYLYCRYVPLLAIALVIGVTNLEGACEYTMNFFIWITFSSSVIAEICFMLRAYALWGISPFAAIFLFILTLGMIAALVVIALNLPTLNNAETPFAAVVAVCFTSEGSLPGSVTGSSIVLLCVDAIVALMVISAKQKRFRAHGTNPLLKRIYQDSIVYFACNCLVMTGSIVISTKLPTASILATRFGSVLTSIIVSRMIIGLKERGNNASSFSQDIVQSTSVSTIQFDLHDETLDY